MVKKLIKRKRYINTICSHVHDIPKYVNFYRQIMPGRMAEIIDLTVDSKRLKTHGVESLLEKTSSSLL